MKNFDFNVFYQPPAEIREHKSVGYTVKVIGGPAEYKAYMEQKAMRLEEERKAKHETYLLKRSFAADIVAGRAKASDEALKPSSTLARFQQEYGAKPSLPQVIQPSNYETAQLEIEAPRWYQRVLRAITKSS